jgi:DNA repair photolyase
MRPQVLRAELARPGYRCSPIAIGVNTDAYQPIEREYRITRSILEVAREANHPVTLITKCALIERDIDLIASLAKDRLAVVTISVITLDPGISRYLEPRASAPARQLLAVKRLSEAGSRQRQRGPRDSVPDGLEMESIMEAAANAGAISAAYNLMRLPWEVKDVFRAWLEERFPLKAAHVMSRVQAMRGGRDNDPSFHSRMVGQGEFAELLAQRFRKAEKRFGLDKPWPELDCTRFRAPSIIGQGALF